MFDAFDFPDVGDFISWKVIIVIIALSILRQFLKGAQCPSQSAKGKNAVVTGANCGIGKQIVRELNYRGATVVMGCRDLAKGEAAILELIKVGCSLDRLILLPLNLSSFTSVRQFATTVGEKFQQLHILVNNAGMMMDPKFRLTEDNHEQHWQVNYLSHFLLAELLTPLLKNTTDESRIVNVSASAHFAGNLDLSRVDTKEGYEPREAYSRSKLAMVMHSKYLTKVLRQTGSHVTANACNPGISYTRIFRYTPLFQYGVLKYPLTPFMWYFMKTPKDGAQTPLYCAVSPKVSGVSGKYFSECKDVSPAETALDEAKCQELFDYSKRACGLPN